MTITRRDGAKCVGDKGLATVRLATWRREKGLTQEELARLLDCTQPYISLIERFALASPPSIAFLKKLYRATNGDVTPNDLVFPDGLPDLDTPELPLDAPPAPLFEPQAAPSPPAAQLQDLAA